MMSAPLPLRWRLFALALICTVPPVLHLVSIERLASHVRSRRAAEHSPTATDLAAEVDRWLTRLPWPWRSTCLKRAAVLYALLRYAGEDVVLRVGVKRQPDRSFAAHAWLVRDGEAYLEHPASTYATFAVIAAFPESASTTA